MQSLGYKRFRIKRLFRNCPKSSGWFGAFADSLDGNERNIKITSGDSSAFILFGLAAGSEIEAKQVLVDHDPRYGVSYLLFDAHLIPTSFNKKAIVSQLKRNKDKFAGVGETSLIALVDACDGDLAAAITMDRADLANKSGVSLRKVDIFLSALESLVKLNAFEFSRRFPSLTSHQITCASKAISDAFSIVHEIHGHRITMTEAVKNPYLLSQAKGLTFKTIDTAAINDLKVPLDSPIRLKEATYDALVSVLIKPRYRSALITYSTEHISAYVGSSYLDTSDHNQVRALLDATFSNLGFNQFDGNMWQSLVSYLDALAADDRIVIEDGHRIYPRYLYQREHSAAQDIARVIGARQSMTALPQLKNDIGVSTYIRVKFPHLGLGSEQMRAVACALRNGISVVYGGPGTGKTKVACAMVDVFKSICKANGTTPYITALAPTGKAVRRIVDSGINVDPTLCRTVMAFVLMLEKEKHEASKQCRKSGLSLTRLAATSLILIDEASMLDVDLFARVMKQVPNGARVVLLGDAGQLPSIRPGEVLHDLLDCAEIPKVELTTVYRQAADVDIIDRAASLREGRPVDALMPGRGYDFEATILSSQADDVACTRYLELWGGGVSPADIALLSFKNRGDTQSRIGLSKRIQNVVNPLNRVTPAIKRDLAGKKYFDELGTEIERTTIPGNDLLRIGDRIMVLENIYEDGFIGTYDDKTGLDGEMTFVRAIYPVNGDTGTILRAYPEEYINHDGDEKGYIVAKLDSGWYLRLPIEYVRESVQLAWAMTVHKSQGSEYKHVILDAASNLPKSFATENLLYTGITRAKESVLLVGEFKTLINIAKNMRIRRRTQLTKRITDQLSSNNP